MFKTQDTNLPFWNQMNYPLDDISRFWSKVNIIKKEDGSEDFEKCWEINTGLNQGYPVFWYNGKTLIATRFIYECFNGPISPNMCICHKCDNPKCVNPYHLWEGTSQENTRDRHNKNRSVKGSDIATSKLIEQDIIDILTKINDGTYINSSQILEDYSISLTNLYKILNGESWTHVNHNYNLKITKQLLSNVENKVNTKLNKDDVLEIVQKYNNGYLLEALSSEYGVSIATISNILNGKTWKHITGIIGKQSNNKGSKNKLAKLTESDVLEIRERLKNGETGSSLARYFGVGEITISRIKHNQRWTHI